MPIGIIMTAVAVLEIHIETAAVETSMPRSRRLGSVPMARMMWTAMRRCRPHCSMPAPMVMPPRKRKMYAPTKGSKEPLRLFARPPPNTPKTGNSTSGTHAVTAIGTASVSHQRAMSAATPAA
jgi:hypothetical protein